MFEEVWIFLKLKLIVVSPDKYTQLNSALFSLNGNSGYVLQPEMMRSDGYDPHQEKKKVKYSIRVKVEFTWILIGSSRMLSGS